MPDLLPKDQGRQAEELPGVTQSRALPLYPLPHAPRFSFVLALTPSLKSHLLCNLKQVTFPLRASVSV